MKTKLFKVLRTVSIALRGNELSISRTERPRDSFTLYILLAYLTACKYLLYDLHCLFTEKRYLRILM